MNDNFRNYKHEHLRRLEFQNAAESMGTLKFLEQYERAHSELKTLGQLSKEDELKA